MDSIAYQEQENFPGDTLEEIDLLDSGQEQVLPDAIANGSGELLNELVLVQALSLESQAHIS